MFHFRNLTLEFLDGEHGVSVQLLLIDIDRSYRGDLSIVIRVMKHDLEPEPVEDLNAAYQGEPCEESKHATNPTHLVSKAHSGCVSDLGTKSNK